MKKTSFAISCLAMITLMAVWPAVSALTTTNQNSVNWSGYIATAPTPFTSVSATWTVPSVTGSTTAFSSAWVGIGGVYRNSNKLIQAGTEQDIISGTPVYTVWYEVYPKPPVTVGTISSGDSVTVSISENSGNPPSWHIKITAVNDNNEPIVSLSQDIDVKAKTNFAAEATAEFIVERPLLVVGHQIAPLAEFSSVTFSGCTTSQDGLSSLDQALAVTMTSDGTSTGTTLASPDNSLSGDSFTISWNAAS
jgi:hypothetical protein